MGHQLCAASCLFVAAGLGVWGCADAVEPSPACPWTVSPSAFSPCVLGGTLTASISAPASCAWRVSSGSTWLSILQGESVRGSGTVVAAYSSNFDAPREGTFTIQAEATMSRRDVRVSQAGCRYGTSPDTFSFDGNGGAGTIDVLQETDPYECGGPKQNACQWSAVTDASWIAISTAMPQVGDQPVRFTVAPSISILPRSGTIVVRDRLVPVLQAGR